MANAQKAAIPAAQAACNSGTASGANAAVEYTIYEYYAPIWQKVSGLIVPYGRCLGPTKTAPWPVGSKSNYSSIRNVLP